MAVLQYHITALWMFQYKGHTHVYKLLLLFIKRKNKNLTKILHREPKFTVNTMCMEANLNDFLFEGSYCKELQSAVTLISGLCHAHSMVIW